MGHITLDGFDVFALIMMESMGLIMAYVVGRVHEYEVSRDLESKEG
jgi:hypothetical protein